MSQQRVKSSIYLNEGLHQRTKALSRATSLSFNTHVALALEEYLKEYSRSKAIEKELASNGGELPHQS